MEYDVIGDVHGHAAKLEALFSAMGYKEVDGLWTPPAGHMALFLGDLIDRGPEQVKVLDIVRAMVGAGSALCIMGNHELNAIGYATPSRRGDGSFLRVRSEKNRAQHAEFLDQVGEDSALHREIIDWFKTLPPMMDLGELRVVHAWWHQPYVDLVQAQFWDGDRMCSEFLHKAFDENSLEFKAIEGLSKGQEIRLPEDRFFIDPSGHTRRNVRTKWWLDGSGGYQQVGMLEDGQQLPNLPVPDHFIGGEPTGAPVMVGHYWFKGKPEVQSPKLAVLDWSAAKGGPLVAYRWAGEHELDSKNMVAAGAGLERSSKRKALFA